MTIEPLMPEDQMAPEDNWVTLLKENARTGGHSAPKLPSPGSVRSQMRVGSSIRTAPVLRGETLYVTSTGGHLHASQTTNGQLRWKFQSGGGIHSTPSLIGSKVLFGCDDGKLSSLSCQQGRN